MTRLPSAAAILTLLFLLLAYYATVDSWALSQQGCRMSYMSPSYRQQLEFDTSWSPLARRYSLWLYREVGWDSDQPIGVPVLFIPGNAGSSRQVRSIASSATRQFYSQPYIISPEFANRDRKPLDFFAVEFNEDLSAFHGPTMESQISYTKVAIEYILSLYPVNTTIIIMGHSMGGIVATSLLPSQKISVIITMSTPHTLPPARFDRRVDAIYHYNRDVLAYDPVPIFSLCGGATDTMIPSESCILPAESVHRRTIFTSALEGAWSGVGHREMVWCHQVRWRIARAALELYSISTPQGRAQVLNRWFRDGRLLPRIEQSETVGMNYQILPEGKRLVLKEPKGSNIYIMPTPLQLHSRFILLVSQGSIGPVSPQHPLPLQVSVLQCEDATTAACENFQPTSLKLVPNPIPGQPFPVPHEGSDESEGVVVFQGDVDAPYIAVKIEGGNGQGWVTGGFTTQTEIIEQTSMLGLILKGIHRRLPSESALHTTINLPNLLSSALLAFRLEVVHSSKEGTGCSNALMPPLLVHTSGPTESHYFPLERPAHLHGHTFAPYVVRSQGDRGFNVTILSSCSLDSPKLTLTLDWWLSLGRWTARFGTTLIIWAVATTSLCVFYCWSVSDIGGVTPTVALSFEAVSRLLLRWLAPASWIVALLPLPMTNYLGMGGEPIFSLLAPLLIFLAFGLVVITWQLLRLMLWCSSHLLPRFFFRQSRNVDLRGIIFSVFILCLVVSLFVPWQVAFLATWIVQFVTCSTMTHHLRLTKVVTTTATNNYNHAMHLLLFMTWLLPLSAPALAVWVKTLLTAGLTAPFYGDHFFLNVAPFLFLVEFVSRAQEEPLFPLHRLETPLRSVRWCFALVAAEAYIFGARTPYSVLDASRICVVVVLVARVGSRYWTSI